MGFGITSSCELDKRLYCIWRGMFERCENPKSPSYEFYGAKGISLCDEWHSFVKFSMWAINTGYHEDLSIDRINPFGNYEPSNCRWATRKEQANNKTVGERFVVNGRIKSFSVRERGKGWEYRIECEKVDGKRKQISKAGYATKEDAVFAAKNFIEQNS